MYDNWFRYGLTEVANNQRVAAYVANGLTPVGAIIGTCDDCGGLAEALGDGVYDSPLVDSPPWVSAEEHDSIDFAGVQIVEVTGLAGATTQVEVHEKVGDGGLVGSRRDTARVIGVTADLVGRTPAGTAVGLEWLTAALHPPCATSGGCGGDVLHLFSACPETCNGQTDPDSVPVLSPLLSEDLTVEHGDATLVTPGTRTNIIAAPSFELGTTVASGWSTHSGGVNGGITREVTATAGVTSQIKAQRVVSSDMDNAVTSFAGVMFEGGLAPGAAYARVDVTAAILPAGRVAQLRVECLNSGLAVVGTFDATASATGTIELTFTAPATTAVARVYLRHIGTATGDPAVTRVETFWDSALLVQGVPSDYFDGASTDTAAYVYAWTGTPNASTSTATASADWLSFDHQPTVEATNLVTQPKNRGASANSASWTVTPNVAITGHPLGFNKAAKVQRSVGDPTSMVASVWALDNLGNYATPRLWGVWVYASRDMNVTTYSGGDVGISQRTTLVGAGEWQFCRTAAVATGHTVMEATPIGGGPTGDDDFIYIAGVTASTSSFSTYFDGDTDADGTYFYRWAGGADNSVTYRYVEGQRGLLITELLAGVCDEVTVTWTVNTTVPTEVSVLLMDSAGVIAQATPYQVVNGTTTISVSTNPTPGFPEDWRTALAVTGDVIANVSVTSRPVLTLEECVSPYRRTLRNVVTVEGPKVITKRTLGDTTDGSTVWRVEWTWVALAPGLWHETVPLLSGVPGTTSAAPVYKADFITLSTAGSITHNSTLCPRPTPSFVFCGDNPNITPLVLPPAAPVIADPTIMNMAGSTYTRRWAEIPADLAPVGLGAFTWRFENDTNPKMGVRVRVYVDTDPAAGVTDECSWVQEFYIDYLAPSDVLHIDGPGGEAYIECGDDPFGQPIYAPADRNLRGDYGGPFAQIPVGCNRAYLVAVDVPQTYVNQNPDASLSGRNNGTSQGSLGWSLSVTRRG